MEVWMVDRLGLKLEMCNTLGLSLKLGVHTSGKRSLVVGNLDSPQVPLGWLVMELVDLPTLTWPALCGSVGPVKRILCGC